MATERPRHIMRNANVWLNRDNLIGQASEIGFPELKRKMQDVWNAGMEVEIDVQVGYEKPEISFELTGYHPEQMKMFGLAPGVETEYMATGANVDDDGTTHSMVAFFRGMVTERSPDAHKRGDIGKTKYKMSFRYYKLEIDGQPIIEMDPFEVKIGGVSQTAGIRRAMLVG